MKAYSFSRVASLFLLVMMLIVGTAFILGRFTSNTAIDEKTQQQLSEYGFYLFNQPRQLTPVFLSDLDSNSVSFPVNDGQWRLINFGYLFCPDICPINLRMLAKLKQEWDQQYSQLPLMVNHITLDPERDQPDNLRDYLAYHHNGFVGFTGELESIRNVARQLNLTFIHEKPDEYGNYFISHSDSIALINPDGYFVGLFKGPYKKDSVKYVLELLINTD